MQSTYEKARIKYVINHSLYQVLYMKFITEITGFELDNATNVNIESIFYACIFNFDGNE